LWHICSSRVLNLHLVDYRFDWNLDIYEYPENKLTAVTTMATAIPNLQSIRDATLAQIELQD
jgi:hypothetical protein